MTKVDATFHCVDAFDPATGGSASQTTFEIHVADGFDESEVAAILKTLRVANEVRSDRLFTSRFVSVTPGYVKSKDGMIVEAEAVLDDVVLPHTMIVVGGVRTQCPAWMRRLRVLQRKNLPIVLLADAATLYIEQTNPSGKVTTHWRHAAQLEETGYYPALSTRLSEKSNGIITAAGGMCTAELIIGLIAPCLTSEQVAELGNRLLLGTIRTSDAEQPKAIADNRGLFDPQITQVLSLMEQSLSDPLPMTALAREVGVSTRQLERAFKVALKETPAKFYKRLRAKKARSMIEETLMPLIEVAVATGFGSNTTLSKAIKEEYGLTPSKMRARKSVELLRFRQG